MPIDENTVFYTGSVSKQFTAAAVTMAAREGYVSLNDDIRTWFPEISDYGSTITVRTWSITRAGCVTTWG